MNLLPRLSARFRLSAVVIASLSALFASAAAGCAGSSSAAMQKGGVAGAQHTMGSVIVKTRKIKGYGTVLVNAKGHTLYMFERDKRQRVTCTGSCASFWPPLKQQGSHRASVGGTAKASLIGSDKDPAGGRVVTYAKWPLYTYVGDSGAGTAKGEGLNNSGGLWYVMSPNGKVIKAKTSGASGGGAWG